MSSFLINYLQPFITPILLFLEKETFYFLILTPVFFIINIFIKNRKPAMYLTLWVLLLFRLILPPELSFEYSVGSLIKKAGIDNPFASQMLVQQNFPVPFPESPAFIQNLSNTESQANVYAEVGNEYSIISCLNNEQKYTVFIIWFSLSIVLFIFFVKNIFIFRRIAGKGQLIETPDVMQLFDRLQKRYQISSSIKLISTSACISPYTIGIFRPKIIIPEGMIKNLSQNIGAVQAVLAHELAHIKRHDSFWLIFQALLQIIYFFNPIVWLLTKNMNKTRERICDSIAIQYGNIPVACYANGLINVIKDNESRIINSSFRIFNMLVPEVSGSKKEMKSRLIQMYKPIKIRGNTKMRFLVTLILGLLLLPLQRANSEQTLKKVSEVPNSVLTKTKEKGTTTPIEISEKNHLLLQKMNMRHPLPAYKITSGFGMRKHPINKKMFMHNGIDIAAPLGTDIFAPANGVVLKTGDKGKKGAGKFMIVDHGNNIFTFYSQLNDFTAKKGDKVAKGQVIALVGNSGLSTGPHLHFEIRIKDEHVNPELYLQK